MQTFPAFEYRLLDLAPAKKMQFRKVKIFPKLRACLTSASDDEPVLQRDIQ